MFLLCWQLHLTCSFKRTTERYFSNLNSDMIILASKIKFGIKKKKNCTGKGNIGIESLENLEKVLLALKEVPLKNVLFTHLNNYFILFWYFFILFSVTILRCLFFFQWQLLYVAIFFPPHIIGLQLLSVTITNWKMSTRAALNPVITRLAYQMAGVEFVSLCCFLFWFFFT